ncbi:hypothetical protein, conserved [Angomonas deanei]|uniref:Uncharacterized protein n=1 Tax=Angomonas deanei TaxID=59799 RepID=A0A7G2C8B2_9TRYP|nr:hypothetical protein, conserved [Angomonas deanei]
MEADEEPRTNSTEQEKIRLELFSLQMEIIKTIDVADRFAPTEWCSLRYLFLDELSDDTTTTTSSKNKNTVFLPMLSRPRQLYPEHVQKRRQSLTPAQLRVLLFTHDNNNGSNDSGVPHPRLRIAQSQYRRVSSIECAFAVYEKECKLFNQTLESKYDNLLTVTDDNNNNQNNQKEETTMEDHYVSLIVSDFSTLDPEAVSMCWST